MLPKTKQKPVSLNGKLQTIQPTLLESLKMEVGHMGQMVYFQIGNHKMEMDYPSAIKLSGMLRTHAKQAKKFAGDASKHWDSASVLTDAELNYKRGW